MKFKLLTTAIISVLGAAAAQSAQAPMPYGYSGQQRGMAHRPMEQQEQAGPAAELKSGMDKLLAFLQQERKPGSAAMVFFLETEIAPFFDFEYMAKSAAGPMYGQMTGEQRWRMANRIKQNFLTTMADRLASYDNQQIRYLAQRMARGGRTGIASVAITGDRSYPARLDFRFYKGDRGWKVYDVMANGQSAVVHYRRQFREMMVVPQQRMRRHQNRPMSYSYHRPAPHKIVSGS